MTDPEHRTERLITPRSSRGGQPRTDPATEMLDAYRQETKRLEDFYVQPTDINAALALAVHRGDADEAERFIAQGADVNRQAESGLPLIHEAAGLGHNAIVDALLASGRCDLTVRDKMGRLPSAIAELVARDYDLAEKLAEEQARQFEAKKMDPRPPDHPDYGNWRWEE